MLKIKQRAEAGMEMELQKEIVQQVKQEQNKEALKKEAAKEQAKEAVAEKTYLAVPYIQRNKAKSLGANGIKTQLWFAPVWNRFKAFKTVYARKRVNLFTLTMPPQEEFRQAGSGFDLKGECPLWTVKYNAVAIQGRAFRNVDGAYQDTLKALCLLVGCARLKRRA